MKYIVVSTMKSCVEIVHSRAQKVQLQFVFLHTTQCLLNAFQPAGTQPNNNTLRQDAHETVSPSNSDRKVFFQII